MQNTKEKVFKDINNYRPNEAFRVIRTNLHFLTEEKTPKIILFTSSIPKEGKSMVAYDYALSVAITGEKVLLIDCDVEKFTNYEKIEISFDNGLESVLCGKYKIDNVILKDVKKNLDIIPTKNVLYNSTELFLGEKIKSILQELKKKYDTIILDTPSLIISSDAAILSKYCDGVVYVVGYRQVTRRELEFGKKILSNAKANIYGFIVNKIDKNGFWYGNCGYYNNNNYVVKIEKFPKIYKFQNQFKDFIKKLKKY